jgi:glycosyltransferase involved in cell wall biosynthesis
MISVITSTYNKHKFLALTLAAYSLQTDKNFELVIVDDGSAEPSDLLVKRYQDKITIRYHYLEKAGLSAARNKALELASGDRIIITDDDRIPSPRFVEEHRRALDRNQHAVSIGKQFRVVSYYSRKIPFEFHGWMKLFSQCPELLSVTEEIQLIREEDLVRDFDGTIHRYLIGEFDPARLGVLVDLYGDDLEGYYFGWTKAFGGNMAFDRRYCTKPVQYDLNYKGYGKEDTDISYQLYEQGFRFIFSPQAANYHQEHPRSDNENTEHFLNTKYFRRKYDTLETFLHELVLQNELEETEANKFMEVIDKYGDVVLPKIEAYVQKKNPVQLASQP